MSQFDVHRNEGRNATRIPYVVVVQSSRFDDRNSRIVVPLWSRAQVEAEVDLEISVVNPVFSVNGEEVILHALQIVSVPCSSLGRKVASLQDRGDAIISALDEVFSRAYKSH